MPDPNRPPLITVFGGGGFVGRHVCEALLKAGARVLVAQRNVRAAHAVQPLGQVGQVGFMAADIRNSPSVAHAVRGADGIINLVGAFSDMDALHADGARTVARAAANAGATSFVHVSAIGADPDAASNYGRTKGEGEAAVREAFAEATIIRPSLVFGPEDSLTNRFAGMGRLPFVPVLKPRTRFQPVYVADLGKAIARAALDPGAHGGRTYEIGGPEVMTFLELQRSIFALAGQSPEVIELPDVAGDVMSRFGFLPGAPLTRDQWLMLGHDNIASKKMPGLADFGIDPTPMSAVAGEWLARFRPGGRFAGRRAPLANASSI